MSDRQQTPSFRILLADFSGRDQGRCKALQELIDDRVTLASEGSVDELHRSACANPTRPTPFQRSFFCI